MPGDVRFARALDDWADTHADWLAPGDARDWSTASTMLMQANIDAISPHVLTVGDTLARSLRLEPFDTALLRLLIAVDRLPRVAALAQLWSEHGRDLPALLGQLAGCEASEADRAVRRSMALRLGLAGFRTNRQGVVEVDIRWPLERLLDRASADHDSIVGILVGQHQPARLALADFAHVEDADFLVRLLTGAVKQRIEGINILIYGPPGTGKTELARTLAATAGLALHGVGEVDDDGEEPTRWERVCALQLAQRMIAPSGEALLLFDEMEDLIGDARPSSGDWMSGRQGSKLFINRLLENNAVPVVWTTNAIGNIDDAILRRMSFVLKLDHPSPRSARRMLERIASEEAVPVDGAVEALLDAAPETASILRVAMRASRIAGQTEDGGGRSAVALVRAMRGVELPMQGNRALDLSLFEASLPLEPLLERLAEGDGQDISMLLTGPPGTGKTALAHHIAYALDRPLVVRRASDLLSRWVGGTEKAIAEAFADARARGHALLFDEADSLLFDRAGARQSWEAGQVNEMLTWLDGHPLPVIAATNHAARLDPAALRRFAFKIDLEPLGPMRTSHAFEAFFGVAPPQALARITGLTPGDFVAVKRQLRHAPADGPAEIVARLARETAWRSDGGRIGF